ncbi:MAG: hypothetical protein A2V98_00880 [Planctomycetes bacterium RBG_16_64_12]|nr:MAG: hypothetical protein A2V98_00880 [Planctomycetes bacterium RBG_16_64_12]
MTRSMISAVAIFMTSGLVASESPDPTLVAHYRFAEGSGDRLLDHSGHGHHGRIVDARARIIVDGVTDAEFACGGDPIYGNVPFKISSTSQSFAGLIHEARLYNRALNAGEIAAEYWREAKRAGKDVSRQGKLLLRGSVYAGDPQVLAEVDFLGVLPLAEGERALVELLPGGGQRLRPGAAGQRGCNDGRDGRERGLRGRRALGLRCR